MEFDEESLVHSKFRKALKKRMHIESQQPPSTQVLPKSPLFPPSGPSYHPPEVFRFDSTDRERYLCSAISEEEEVFSPFVPGGQVHSPKITISSLSLQDSPPYTPHDKSPLMDAQRLGAVFPSGGFSSISPISPLTPNTPLSPLFGADSFQHGFLQELYRRRCHSDSDLPVVGSSPRAEGEIKMRVGRVKKLIPHPLKMPPSKGGSLESDASSPQDSPLDLSMKGSRERFSSSTSCESLSANRFISPFGGAFHHSPSNSPGVSVIRGDIASPTTRNSVALRYNLEVSPVVEEMPPGADLAFVCPVCGQMFSLHDRLAKHMASRHKSKPHDPNKSYPCDICKRSFARSDMLTRHVRLHTGIKPYTCKVCGQVFSRSDHLSTHQRTHTGEKPYKCPQCAYAACRRDMITRHLRTHTRNSSDLTSTSSADSVDYSEPNLSIKMEQAEPLSPSLHISHLSLINSPPPPS